MTRSAGPAWRGWPPSRGPGRGWIDLTHPISSDVPRLRKFARILLGNGVLIGENLSNLGRPPERVEAMMLPLPILGADGSPMRVLARYWERD